jgi:hypothetical protein
MSEKPKIVDTECLSDADWAEINKLLRAYEAGGTDAFWEAIEELGDADPVRYIAVAGAFFPDVVRKIISDEMSE